MTIFTVTKFVAFALAIAAVALAVATQSGRAATTGLNCGSLSLGPGGAEHGAATGSRCLLRAYEHQCQQAVYSLSLFGIDTISKDQFHIAHAKDRCLVLVTISFRVVPQPARQHTGVCSTLVLRSRHVVAAHCTGEDIPASIVLDPNP